MYLIGDFVQQGKNNTQITIDGAVMQIIGQICLHSYITGC